MVIRFTYLVLVEIVTALIGLALLTVGVIQGMEILNQVRSKKVIVELNEYNTAAKSFMNKYGKLPGDYNYAHSRGIDKACDTCDVNTYATMATFIKGINDGNGDGRLNSAGNGFFNFSGEMRNFWVHLSNTGFISYEFTENKRKGILEMLMPSAEASMISKIGLVGEAFPEASLGTGILALTDNKDLNFVLGVEGKVGPNLGPEGSNAIGDTLSTQQAYLIDSKLDDGMPGSGFVRVVGNYNGYTGKFEDDSTLSKKDCYSGPGLPYNLKVLLKVCTIRIKNTLLTGQSGD